MIVDNIVLMIVYISGLLFLLLSHDTLGTIATIVVYIIVVVIIEPSVVIEISGIVTSETVTSLVGGSGCIVTTSVIVERTVVPSAVIVEVSVTVITLVS